MLRECKDLSTAKKKRGISEQSTSDRGADTSPLSDFTSPAISTGDEVDWSWLNFDTVNAPPMAFLGSPMMEIPGSDPQTNDIVSPSSNTTKLKSERLTESPGTTPKAEIISPQLFRPPNEELERNIPAGQQDYLLRARQESPKGAVPEKKSKNKKDSASIMTASTTSLRSGFEFQTPDSQRSSACSR